MAKGEPLRARLEENEQAMLERLKLRTGMIAPDIVRRAIRLLYREVEARGPGFILDELSSVDPPSPSNLVAEKAGPPYGPKKEKSR